MLFTLFFQAAMRLTQVLQGMKPPISSIKGAQVKRQLRLILDAKSLINHLHSEYIRKTSQQ